MRAQLAHLWNRPAMRFAAIGLVLGAAIAGFLVVLLSSPPRTEPTLLRKPVTVEHALSAAAALFGDRIEAEVDVYSDDRLIDAHSVRVRSDFTPYRVVTTRVDRSRRGRVSLQRTRIELACLTTACVPPTAGGTLRFRPSLVTYRTLHGAASEEIPWDPIRISSRIPAGAALRVGAGVVDAAPPVDPRFAISPALLRGLLLLGAAVLGLAGAALVVSGLWPPLFSSFRRTRPLSPVESSLLEVEAAARGGDETARRRVLEQLALHLGELPSPTLEAETRALAWAESTPEPEALALLAQEVRSSLNGDVGR